MCKVVKCGLYIPEALKNPYDIQQHVITHTHSDNQIFIIIYVVMSRKICEWRTGKDVEWSSHGMF